MTYLTRDDYILDVYLNKQQGKEGRPMRPLTPADLELTNEVRRLYYDFNAVLFEIITSREVLKKIGKPELNYIIKNLNRITMSAVKQRNKGWAVRSTITLVKPNEEEVKAIRAFLDKGKERIRFLRECAVTENIKLTPIQEYLEIIGKNSLKDDMKEKFTSGHEIYEITSRKDPEKFEAYVNGILQTVTDAGRMEDFNARIEAYIQMEDEKDRRRVKEKAEEKLQKRMAFVEDGMMNFQQMFHHAVFHFETCERIKISDRAIYKAIADYGRNVWYVLCCYIGENGKVSGKAVYRYLGETDLVDRFCNARAFLKEGEALKEMIRLQEAWPDRIFEVVKLSELGEESA